MEININDFACGGMYVRRECCGDGPDDYCADCPERVGNDGLTDAQRAELARRYRETVCAPLTPEEAEALREWRAKRRRQ